jgi:hypothetical protein
MLYKRLIKGMATYVPGLYSAFPKRQTGGTDSARYCYSVWLRHLVLASRSSLSTSPTKVAELGPGDSIGIGLAALLCGAEQYCAFDVVEYAQLDKNLNVFDELVGLFKGKEDIPGNEEFPKVRPKLESYEFPSGILTAERLNRTLNDGRIARIREAIENVKHTKCSMIRYVVPWYSSDILDRASIDMVFSQAVMEHVEDVANTYKALYSWLKPEGFMSHQIDFSCHGTADEWNGHWAYSDFVWKLIKGKRPFLINRMPLSTHIRLLKETGFNIVRQTKVKIPSKLRIADLSLQFRDNISEDDLATRGVFIQATIT